MSDTVQDYITDIQRDISLIEQWTGDRAAEAQAAFAAAGGPAGQMAARRLEPAEIDGLVPALMREVRRAHGWPDEQQAHCEATDQAASFYFGLWMGKTIPDLLGDLRVLDPATASALRRLRAAAMRWAGAQDLHRRAEEAHAAAVQAEAERQALAEGLNPDYRPGSLSGTNSSTVVAPAAVQSEGWVSGKVGGQTLNPMSAEQWLAAGRPAPEQPQRPSSSGASTTFAVRMRAARLRAQHDRQARERGSST